MVLDALIQLNMDGINHTSMCKFPLILNSLCFSRFILCVLALGLILFKRF